MKKRILSMSLAAVMLAGTLFSCQAPEESGVSSRISVASSDAAAYADWLTDRLTTIPDEVVVGIGSNNTYGVDMSTFEDDGYIVKRTSDQVVIFGKTADGLDRGVRKYANAVDTGETIESITYHEGERIEELKLFGSDISEFVINYPESYNANMEFAATELRMLVEKATGVNLEIVVGATDAAKKIELRHTDDATLEEDGYRYFEENGNLVIEGAVDRGCLNGVYRFLQNECGWDGLIYGDSYLNEADLIEIPAGLSESEVPIMPYIYVHGNFWNGYKTDRTDIAWNSVYNSYGSHEHAHHGMDRYYWHPNGGGGNHGSQMCYSSDGNYWTVYDNVVLYIENHEANGGKAGVTFKDVDISQGDNNRYCMCDDCAEILIEEQSHAGAILRFANRLAEDLNDIYDNIGVHFFAYFASKKPPVVTKAHDMVFITFAQNGNCSNHSMYGEECQPSEIFDDYLVSNSNADNHMWLSAWCELAKNVNVWYYALDTVLHQYTILDFLLDDFRYMDEYGVRGMFWQIPYHGFGIKRVEQQLGLEINWQKDMTDEEYEAELCRLLEREYGDGWEYIREYIDLWIEATDRIGCFNCWGYGSNANPEYDWAFMKDSYEYMAELLEKAITMAGSADQEYRCKLLSCSVYYSGVFSSYFTAYEAEDEATLAKLNEQYDFVVARIEELGFNLEAITSVDNGKCKVYPTLEEEAWNVWLGERENHVGTEDLRPAPDWFIDQATATVAPEPAV